MDRVAAHRSGAIGNIAPSGHGIAAVGVAAGEGGGAEGDGGVVEEVADFAGGEVGVVAGEEEGCCCVGLWFLC